MSVTWNFGVVAFPPMICTRRPREPPDVFPHMCHRRAQTTLELGRSMVLVQVIVGGYFEVPPLFIGLREVQAWSPPEAGTERLKAICTSVGTGKVQRSHAG